ncbi:MAG: enoyl-CoA hydratase/isomerase family protein [Gemmatimonadota bacterium]|nr:enoyl-CoA hydratase/isomerase family protein [Gemmatimonadota bacterium]
MSGNPTAVGTVKYELHEDIAFVTLDAPPLNILTAAVMADLTASVEFALTEPTARALVLRAEGRAFSAGADVAEHRPEQAPEMIAAFGRLFDVLAGSELPIVAAVEGAALGAGFELAMMADILIATDRATFGQPEIRLGFFAPLAVAWLGRRLGIGRAIEITALGRTYSAAEMHEFGLVSQVVPADALHAALDAVLGDLRRTSAAVMRMNVRLVRASLDRPFAEARHAAERVFLDELMATEDVREGIAAFCGKRRPAWQHC